jgi:hypothetical protein
MTRFALSAQQLALWATIMARFALSSATADAVASIMTRFALSAQQLTLWARIMARFALSSATADAVASIMTRFALWAQQLALWASPRYSRSGPFAFFGRSCGITASAYVSTAINDEFSRSHCGFTLSSVSAAVWW